MKYAKKSVTGPLLRLGAGALASAMLKRKKVKSKTKTKSKPKTKSTTGDHNEYRKYTYKQGRKPRVTLRNVAREVFNARSTMILSHRDFSTWGSAQGALILGCAQTAFGSPIVFKNIMLFDLTAIQNTNSAGSVLTPISYQFPQFTNETDTGTLSWGNGPNLTVEKNENPTSNSLSYPGRSADFQWTSIKALLYSAQTIATKVEFTILRFTDDLVCPGAASTTKGAAFWQSIVFPSVKNPIATNSPYWTKRCVKVISRKTFVLDPKETTEAVSANLTEVNMFLRHGGKTIRYDVDSLNDRINLLTDDETLLTQVTIRHLLHRHRRYIL